MKLEIFLVIGLIVNSLFAVLYPEQIFGDDPLGIDAIKQEKINEYYTAGGLSPISSYNSTSEQLIINGDLFGEMKDSVVSTEGDAGIFGTDTFSFIDWVKVGWGLLKSALMFVLGFIFMLWSLVYPLNFLIGVPFTMLYIFAMVRFIVGR